MEITYKGVHYLDTTHFNTFTKPIDIMLINRFMNFFLHFKSKAVQTYYYAQDICLNYMYDGKILPDFGKHFIHNICQGNLLNGIICISPYQQQNIKQVLGRINTPSYIIGNGISSAIPEKNLSEIITNRFIYCSDPSRGLVTFLECIIELQKYIPTCSVVIFRSSEFKEDVREKLTLITNKTLYDTVSHDKIMEEFVISDIWFYPCNVEEAYCNCASEAQLYNTLCVYNTIGALETTIGDRGVALDPNAPNYIDYCVKKIIDLLQNTELKKTLREKGYNWAKKEVFEYKIDQWYSLFES
tara:strand:- start:460 stop:1356 length:897 start_codon:yes stop_codon:yes gene_type:complete